jgi:hypothetical protein
LGDHFEILFEKKMMQDLSNNRQNKGIFITFKASEEMTGDSLLKWHCAESGHLGPQ